MEESSNTNDDTVVTDEEEISEEVEEEEEVEDDENEQVDDGEDLSEGEGDDDDQGNATSDDSSSGNETTGRCTICLQRFLDQDIGVPEDCDHRFCLECIKEWAKTAQTCPIDRKPFHAVLVTRDGETILRVEELQRLGCTSPLPEDITHCEICGLGDREDRLLLCDECDFAYHLECLDPPLEMVPLDDWFCPTCVARQDRIEQGPPVIHLAPTGNLSSDLTTVSNSLLRRRIRQRRQKSRRNTTSSKGKPTRRRKRKSKTSRRSKIGTTVKGKGGAKSSGRRRKTRKVKRRVKRKRPRLVIEEKPTTSRGRLAHQLGILPPKPGQIYVGLPICRSTLQPAVSERSSGSSSSINHQRFRAGIAPLRLYSTNDDLADCIENESDDDNGSVATIRPQAPRIHAPGKFSFPFKNGVRECVQVSGPNILSEIMNSQKILLQDRNIRIGMDGLLFPSSNFSDRLLSDLSSNRDRQGGSPISDMIEPNNPDGRSNSQPSRSNIMQAPLDNTQSSGNFSQFRKTSSSGNGSADQYTWSDGASLNSSSSLGRGSFGMSSASANNTGQPFERELGPLNLSPHRNPDDKTPGKNKDQRTKQTDDDDDYNIYSDIEDRGVASEGEESGEAEIPETTQVEKSHDSDNDIDMIIDEGNSGRRKSSERSTRNNCDLPDQSNNESQHRISIPNNIESDDSTSHGMPEADSPESIPLPDSTPPPSVPMSNHEEDEIPEIQGGSILYSPSDDDENRRQEYDPSQPLTSSDEEEHSNKQASNSITAPPPKKKEDQPRNSKAETNSNAALVDVSSIPVPGEEYRRPTIQFSIPSRHKLIPISSLIKRQKGVLRKDSSVAGASNYQSEVSKAFGRDDDREGGEDENDTQTETQPEKVSLVAEIFGSDEDEEDKVPAEEQKPGIQPSTVMSGPEETAKEDPTPALGKPEPLPAHKWKKVEVEVPVEPEPSAATLDTLSGNSSISLPLSRDVPRPSGVNQIATVSVTDLTNVKVMEGHSELNSKKNPSSFLEIVSDDSDNEVTIISHSKKRKPLEDKSNPDVIILSPEKSNSSSLRKKKDKVNGKDKDNNNIDKSSGKQKEQKTDRRHKRRRSSSSVASNFEEGEIITPEKKRKKGKKKKAKKRKRSRDSQSSANLSFDERPPPERRGINSSSDVDEDGKKVSWRKPSKSTKERNYRDGKPKTEEKYFREKEKARSRSRDRNREKSPRQKSKDKPKGHSRKARRKSVSRQRSLSRSPRWSKSRSTSRSRLKEKRTRLRSLSSRRSLSPRQSAHSPRSPRLRRSTHHFNYTSIRKDRSRSGSLGRHRSRSPLMEDRYRSRKLSKERSRANHGRSGRGHSSSASRSGSRSRTRKKHEKLELSEKLKKGKRDKEKSAKELAAENMPQEAETKEKRKKKRKKEKSVSPAKAVFADGDSIVISLNFQKPKEPVKESPEKSETNNEDKIAEKRKKRNSGRDSTTKNKPTKKTILIDLETSPVQEQKIGDSPALVVLSDDEENSNGKSKGNNSSASICDREAIAVSTTEGIDDLLSSPAASVGKVAQADSTQIQQSESLVKDADSQGSERNTSSPARGDSFVTSTRDSIEGTLPNDEAPSSNSNSPQPSELPPLRSNNSPALTTPPLPVPATKADVTKSAPTSATLTNTTPVPPLPMPNAASSGQGLPRPLGIGNIPGLFPSSSVSTSGLPIPPMPIVIPAPPAPQLRFPPTSLNPSINILASVANALYGPLMAARQSQPLMTKSISVNSQRPQMITQSNTLLPKNQNSHSHVRRSAEAGGDSPFSPNSSEGDDLFEPPEKRNKDGPPNSHTDKSLAANQSSLGIAPSLSKAKSKNELFDTLFGSPSKKSGTTTTAPGHSKLQSKPSKSKLHNSMKVKKVVTKKEVQKLTEGELRQTEDVPTSAVELRVKEKFLKKLNRQERVVEEVKLALKPHYGNKSINKEEYKDILRRAVPKICHNKSGEINPNKIKEMVEAYVKKFKHARRKQP